MKYLLIVVLLLCASCRKDPNTRFKDQAQADALALTGIKMDCVGGPTVGGNGNSVCQGGGLMVSCPADMDLHCTVIQPAQVESK